MTSDSPRTKPHTVPQARFQAKRMVIVLLTILTGLLLALGVLGWWSLARIDARYTRMVDQTASLLNDLEEVGVHSFTGYGTMMELRQTQDPDARAALLHTILEQRAANDRLYEKLQLTLTDPKLRDSLQALLAMRMECRKEAQAFLAPGNAASAVSDAGGSLRFLQDCVACQQARDRLTDQIENASLEACREMSGEVRNLRWLFLGVGILPVATALVLLVAILTLVRVVNLDSEQE